MHRRVIAGADCGNRLSKMRMERVVKTNRKAVVSRE